MSYPWSLYWLRIRIVKFLWDCLYFSGSCNLLNDKYRTNTTNNSWYLRSYFTDIGCQYISDLFQAVYILSMLSHLALSINSSANFFVYVAWGSKFRYYIICMTHYISHAHILLHIRLRENDFQLRTGNLRFLFVPKLKITWLTNSANYRQQDHLFRRGNFQFFILPMNLRIYFEKKVSSIC